MLEPSTALLADVAELCRRLDGLPLAIELAAARTAGDRARRPARRSSTSASTCCGAASGLGDRHDTMRGGDRGVDVAAVARDERRFFRRLGVFTGPFDLGLAHAVAGEPGERDVCASLDMLAALVDRSLVTAET